MVGMVKDTTTYESTKNSDEPIVTSHEAEKAALNPLRSQTLSTDAPRIVTKAAEKEAKKPVQIIDSDTKTHEVLEEAPGKPVAMILSKEERPIDTVFQNIVNFRDIGGNYNYDSGTEDFRTLNFFRSGRLDDADSSDISLLKDKYDIKCVIDLRSETEGRMGENLVNTFPASAIAEQLKPSEIVFNPAASKKPTEPTMKTLEREHEETGTGTRVTFYVNFAGRRFRYYAVWKPLHFRQKMKTIYLMASGKKQEAIAFIGHEIVQPGGLYGLNQGFVDNCGGEIVQALKLMSKPEHYPILVHCTQGKDRTGLVVALALSLCGVSDELIVKDYARTQQGLARQRDVMVEEMRKTGLDPSFSDAPPEVMEKTLNYIREQYGTHVDYLKQHGLTDQHIFEIRCRLLVKQPPQM